MIQRGGENILEPGGVRELRIPLPLPLGGDAVDIQSCSGWASRIRFSDKSHVTLLILTEILQFTHISTSVRANSEDR